MYAGWQEVVVGQGQQCKICPPTPSPHYKQSWVWGPVVVSGKLSQFPLSIIVALDFHRLL